MSTLTLFSSVFNLFSTPFSSRRRHSSTPTHKNAPFTVPIYRRVKFDAFPDEILHEIFLIVVTDGFANAVYRFGTAEKCAPWNIAAVCANWRRICLVNANLWTYFVLRWHRCSWNLGGYDDASIIRTYLQLERSRDHLLHVDASIECDCRCAVSALRALGKVSHRWKSVHYTNGDWIEDCVSASVFHQLKHLTWQRDLMGEIYGVFTCPFPELTSLRSVKFTWFIASESDSLLPWKQLTHLNFYEFTGSFYAVLDVISQCVALTNLQLRMDLDSCLSDENSRHCKPDSVILPNLSFLDFTGGYRASAVLLPCLRLPSLRTLIFNATCTPITTLIDLIDRSSCSLTRLELHLESELSGFSALDGKLQQLETFVLRDIRHIYPSRDRDENIHCDRILDHLTVQESRDVLCPRLKHLKLHNIAFDPVLLAHMVDSRQDSNDDSISTLQSVTVSIYGPKWPRIKFYQGVLENVLRKRMQDGLEVHFHDTDRRRNYE